MADLRTLCLDDECMAIPIGGGGGDSGVSGVKGKFETDYRDGDVDLTTANIAFIGTNVTGGSANDTMAFWRGKGTGYAFFNATGQLNGQPSQWGFVDSFVNAANEINQIWRGQDNKVYIRKANTSTTAMPAWTPIDTTYTAGDNVDITNNQISVPDSVFQNKMKVLDINKTLTGTIANNAQTDITYANSYKFDRGGIFVGAVQVQMAANTNGARFVGALKYNADGSVAGSHGNQRNAPPSTGQWMGTAPVILRVEKNQAIAARMYQNSGSSLAYTVYLGGKLFYNFSE